MNQQSTWFTHLGCLVRTRHETDGQGQVWELIELSNAHNPSACRPTNKGQELSLTKQDRTKVWPGC